MPATVIQITSPWEKLKSSTAYKKHEDQCGFAALCVVGTSGRQPRKFGDNEGVHPTRLVVTTGDPARAADIFNRGVHSVMARYDTQAYVYWTTRKFAEDAKDWIERQVPGEPLLHGWTSIEPWQWEIMFNEAGLSIGRECFDEAEKVRRIWARVKSGRG